MYQTFVKESLFYCAIQYLQVFPVSKDKRIDLYSIHNTFLSLMLANQSSLNGLWFMKISYQTSWKGSNYHRRKITKPSSAMAKAWHYKRQLHLFMVGIWACFIPKLRVLLSQRHSTTVSLETKPSLDLLEHLWPSINLQASFFSLRNFSTNFSPRIISTKDTMKELNGNNTFKEARSKS